MTSTNYRSVGYPCTSEGVQFDGIWDGEMPLVKYSDEFAEKVTSKGHVEIWSTFPPEDDLYEWISEFCPYYLDMRNSRRFCEIVNVRGAKTALNYRPCVDFDFLARDTAGKLIFRGKISQVNEDYDCTSISLDADEYLRENACLENILIANIVRFHLLKFCTTVANAAYDRKKCKSGWCPRRLRRYKPLLEQLFERDREPLTVFRAIVRTRSYVSKRCESLFENISRLRIPRRNDSLGTPSNGASVQNINEPETETTGLNGDTPGPLDAVETQVGYTGLVCDVVPRDEVKLSIVRKLRNYFKRDAARVDTLETTEDIVIDPYDETVVEDDSVCDAAPCFRVINSSIRHIEGYARLHIGDGVPANFKGKRLYETTIGELKKEIEDYCKDLKSKGVRGVLISGYLWTNKCKFSGSVLNDTLPKAFDGMVVRVISCGKYADGMASKLREYYGVSDDINMEPTYDLYTTMNAYPDTSYVEKPDLTTSFTDTPDTVVLQTTYNEAYPCNSEVDQDMKLTYFHQEASDVDMSDINVRDPFHEYVTPKPVDENSYLVPIINTHLEHRHPVNQRELLHSVYNRSYMPPKEYTLISSLDAATELFEEFKDSLIQEPLPILVSDTARSNYLQRKGADQVADLKRLMEDLPQDPSKWMALVKGDAKPKMDDNTAAEYAPTQTIICKDKLYNHKFGPYFTEMKKFIVNNLKREYFVFSEDDVEGFEKKLTAAKYNNRMRGKVMEIDMSKYDKSQGFTSLYLEMMIMAYFGMPLDLIVEWCDSHWYTYIKSMTGPTSFEIPPQRKSGDPWTYYGNTIYLMCVLKSALRKIANFRKRSLKLNYMMISGDDSLLWGDFDDYDYDNVCDILVKAYNLDAKLFRSNVLCFCSRIMVTINDYVHLVPDPVKALIKLGKKDIRDRAHAEDLRISLLDHINLYKYVEIRDIMISQIEDRYGIGMIDVAMEHMYSFAYYKQLFYTLFSDSTKTTDLAIIVPHGVEKYHTVKAVWHDTLIRRVNKVRSMDPLTFESYMRSVGKNSGGRILITYKREYVPQGFRVVADLSDSFSFGELKELIHYHSKKG